MVAVRDSSGCMLASPPEGLVLAPRLGRFGPEDGPRASGRRTVVRVKSVAISFALTALLAAAVFLSWGVGVAPAAF